MSIKQVSGYITSDGEFFEDCSDAERHQLALDFSKWYSDNPIMEEYDSGIYPIDCELVSRWIETHLEDVEKFILRAKEFM